MADSSTPFEGVEKRLQMVFSSPNLRKKLTRMELERILEPVDCYIEGILSEHKVDAYLLSASSLFVYDDVVIVKTCGRTKIFECVEEIFRVAEQKAESVLYTRGAFFRPEAQPFPHRLFSDEISELRRCLQYMGLKDMSLVNEVLGKEKKWHVISGRSSSAAVNTDVITVEMCMRELNREKASVFYKSSSDKSMTEASGIGLLFPDANLQAHEFDPCGYSVNGVRGDAIFTIHVAPEEGCSFASFETFGYNFKTEKKLNDVAEKVLDCFKPNEFTLVIHSTGQINLDDPVFNIVPDGYHCSRKEYKSLGLGGSTVYFSFTI